MILLLDLALLALIPVFAVYLIIALVQTTIGITQMVLGLILLAGSYLIDAIVWPYKVIRSLHA